MTTTATTGTDLVPYDDARRPLRPGAGPRGARRAQHRVEDVLRLPDGVRRRAEHPGLPGVPGAAGCAAGAQRDGGRVRDPDRAGPELRDRRVVPVRAEELLLPGHAEELPDLAVRRADRFDGWTDVTVEQPGGVEDLRDRHRARAHGGGHRQVAARRRRDRPHPRRRLLPRRLQPRRHPAHRDRHEADRGHRRDRARGRQARTSAHLRDMLRGLGVSDVRMEQGSLRCDVNLSLRPVARAPARHPQRDQERQLAALGRARRALRGLAAGRAARRGRARSCRRPGTGTRTPASPRPAAARSRPRTTATSPSPTSCRSRPPREWVEELRAALPEPPRERRARLQAGVGLLRPRDARRRRRRCADLVEATVAAGATPAAAAQVVARPSSPAAPTSRASSWRRCRSRPEQVAQRAGAGRRRPRQRQAGPPGPRRRPRRRGLARRGRRRPRAGGRLRRLRARSPRSTGRSRPTPTSPRRSAAARQAAAGALIGAVMKEMRGQADAGRVRELILERLTWRRADA